MFLIDATGEINRNQPERDRGPFIVQQFFGGGAHWFVGFEWGEKEIVGALVSPGTAAPPAGLDLKKKAGSYIIIVKCTATLLPV